jgi:hypothetical protein
MSERMNRGCIQDRNVPSMALIMDRVEPEPNTGCWLWLRYQNRQGYGVVSINNRATRAHRVVYEVVHGTIPNGLVIDHICNTPSCVNPDHLRAITSVANTLRGTSKHAINKRKTVCREGHPLVSANNPRRPAERTCHICRRAYNRAYHRRRKERAANA